MSETDITVDVFDILAYRIMKKLRLMNIKTFDAIIEELRLFREDFIDVITVNLPTTEEMIEVTKAVIKMRKEIHEM